MIWAVFETLIYILFSAMRELRITRSNGRKFTVESLGVSKDALNRFCGEYVYVSEGAIKIRQKFMSSESLGADCVFEQLDMDLLQ